ncbi:phosphatidylethanolamine-binding protein 4 isoform 1-T1 [Mergus octosetaceus]
MELLGAVLLAASLLGTTAWGAQAPWPDEPSHTCFFQTLSSPDSEFCRGDLEVIYPQLGDVGCSYIPQCHQYRWRISREWGSPRVRYPRADKSKKYVLVLVDPDAPSRANPRNRFWRHWLLADVRTTCAPRPRLAAGTTATSSACTSSRPASTSPWALRSCSHSVPGRWRASWRGFASAPPWPRRSSSPSTTRISRGAWPSLATSPRVRPWGCSQQLPKFPPACIHEQKAQLPPPPEPGGVSLPLLPTGVGFLVHPECVPAHPALSFAACGS